MEIPLDIWLRGEVHATSHVISVATGEPGRWTDDDVTAVLEGMLRALEQAKNPDADEHRRVAMRGFSWIVNPYDGGGVVIALELSLGAVIAGPFDVAELAGVLELVAVAGLFDVGAAPRRSVSQNEPVPSGVSNRTSIVPGPRANNLTPNLSSGQRAAASPG